jgi:hypothetical protein
VVFYNRQILYVAFLLCVLLILFTGVLMYYLRPRDEEDAGGKHSFIFHNMHASNRMNRIDARDAVSMLIIFFLCSMFDTKDFQSIAATMYLSTLMLTGQGGPAGDLPWYTKGVVLLTGAFSIGMFAIPASMLTWGFEAEAARVAARSRQLSKMKNSTENDESETWSYSTAGYSTDEEYQRLIAGEGSDDESDELKEIMTKFAQADEDGSGNISLKEFIALSQQQQHDKLQSLGTSGNGTELSRRIAGLESRVKENSAKLDKVCKILEAIQKSLK